MSQPVNWILILAGAILILVEVLLGAISGFDFLLIGSAVLLGGVIGLLLQNPVAGVAAAGVLSILYVLVGRKRIRKRLRRPGIRSNTDALLGRSVLVSETITANRPGRIQADGEEWRAAADSPGAAPIDKGQRAVVTRIDGVTVFVAAPEEQEGRVPTP